VRWLALIWFGLLAAPAPTEGAARVAREVATCEQGCATRAELSETDRISCQLQCSSIRRAFEVRSQGIRQAVSGTTRPTPVPTTFVAPAPAPGTYTTTLVESSRSPAEIASCQLGCDQAGLSTTDRATCKLNCAAQTRVVHVVTATAGAAPGPAPAAPAAPPAPATIVHRPTGDAAAAAACERDCNTRGDLSETDRATCRLGCTRHTTVVVEQWTQAPAPGPAGAPAPACAQGCACVSGCASHHADCGAGCSAKKGSDASTCRLQCEAVRDSCRNACRVGGCGCTP
jgi:hypothetical protein